MDKLLRLVDANVNRAQEGLRVCEDIVRFILDDKKLQCSFKSIRHKVYIVASKIKLIKSRDVRKDIGRFSTIYSEGRRKTIVDVFRANIQRAKESLRVLEEVFKLIDIEKSQRFKELRYRIYELEKKSRVKLEALLRDR